MAERVLHGGDIYRNRVKYDFSVNVNPLGMPESVRDALRAAADLCECYPDPDAQALRHAIGGFYGVPSEQILCGSGSSELLMAVVHALRPARTVIPVPSFYGYERAARSADGEIVYCGPEKDPERILTQDVSLLFLANPNNPTGDCILQERLQTLLDHCRENEIVVVLDECFLEFVTDGSARSCLTQMRRWPNLIVLRAFTKIFAVPGVRLGWLSGADPDLLERIKRHLPEWNVSLPAQQAGLAAMKVLKETDYLEETVRLVCREREFLARELQSLGIRVYPSKADFLLLYSDVALYEPLLVRGFLIRDCADFRGLGEGYYRVAVKTREENALLLAAMKEILGKGE